MPPISTKQTIWLAASGFAILTLLIVAFATPFVGSGARGLIMEGFQKVCHQLPSRSFHIDGIQIALCHRCVGIYAALPLVIALFAAVRRWDAIIMRHPLGAIGISLIPMAIDWGADLAGLWVNTPLSRLLTGSAFGVVAGYFLARGVAAAAAPSRAAREATAAVPGSGSTDVPAAAATRP